MWISLVFNVSFDLLILVLLAEEVARKLSA
jgi:hypothetical protein